MRLLADRRLGRAGGRNRRGWRSMLETLEGRVLLDAGAARVLCVDDNAPFDPGPGDPLVSDPLENGSAAHPFDAIQDGIAAAKNGDMVLVLDGRYEGHGNHDIDFLGKAIIVRSQNGAASTIVDAICPLHLHHGFYFHSHETAAAVVDGFTITNGRGDNGGGIYCDGASPTIRNCTITGNQVANDGGGIYAQNGSPAISQCVIEGNQATNGAGIAAYDGTPMSVAGCTITNNQASRAGGGLYIRNSDATVSNSTIRGNTAAEGGGIRCRGDAPAISNCVIADNSAPQTGGGGILLRGGAARISGCTFAGNGDVAVFGLEQAAPTISGSLIAGNAGGIASLGGAITVLDSTVADNNSYSGMLISGGSLTVRNSIVWGNDSGGSANDGNIALTSGAVASVAYSDIEGGFAGAGNIEADPRFIARGQGDDAWTGGDYRVQMISPCIDAGSNAAVAGTLSVDLEGDARIIGSAVDLGAYEFPGEPVRNGGFETGDASGWQPADWHDDWTKLQVTPYMGGDWVWGLDRSAPHSGTYSRMIAQDLEANRRGQFYQNVDLSHGFTVLSFWLNADLNPNGGLNPGTWAGAELREADGGQLIAGLVSVGSDTPGHCGTDGWQRYQFDLSPYLQRTMAEGGDPSQVSVTFYLQTKNNSSGAPQRLYVDDVMLARPCDPPTVNNPPIAVAGQPYQVLASNAQGSLVQLDGTGSVSPAGAALSYEWDLDRSVDSNGDGDPTDDVDATGPTPLAQFPVGRKEISLTVVDAYGVRSRPVVSVGWPRGDVTTVTVWPSVATVSGYAVASQLAAGPRVAVASPQAAWDADSSTRAEYSYSGQGTDGPYADAGWADVAQFTATADGAFHVGSPVSMTVNVTYQVYARGQGAGAYTQQEGGDNGQIRLLAYDYATGAWSALSTFGTEALAGDPADPNYMGYGPVTTAAIDLPMVRCDDFVKDGNVLVRLEVTAYKRSWSAWREYFISDVRVDAFGPRVQNGGFETGDASGWQPADWQDAWTKLAVTPYMPGDWVWGLDRSAPHSGTYSRMIDLDLQANRSSQFYQNVDISHGFTVLSFWLNANLNPNGGLNPGTWAGAELREADGGALIASLVSVGSDTPGPCGTDGWQGYQFDLSPYLRREMANGADPSQVSVTFYLQTKNNWSGAPQRLYVDDVMLSRASDPPPVNNPPAVPLHLSGDAGGSAFYVRRDDQSSSLEVWRGTTPTGSPAQTQAWDTCAGIVVTGGDGKDTLVLDLSNGSVIPAGGIQFVSGGGVDTIIVTGTGPGDAVSVAPGRITIDGGVVTCMDAANVQLGQGKADVVVGSLAIEKSARVGLAPDAKAALRTAQLAMDDAATLDLFGNDLVVEAADAAGAQAALAFVTGRIAAARNAKLPWQGPGITSTSARNDAIGMSGLGVVASSAPAAKSGGASVLVRYTRNGDTDLNGRIDTDDYLRLDYGYLTGKAAYRFGDFNYDGKVSADDYALIDASWLGQAMASSRVAAPASAAHRKGAVTPAKGPAGKSHVQTTSRRRQATMRHRATQA